MKRHRARFDHRGLLAMRADAWGLFFEVEEPSSAFELRGDVAIVTIDGPLMHHAEWWWDSYDAIKTRVTEALESPAKTVLLYIDSPGGLVAGCYDTARWIREAAASKGKRVVAYTDGMAASAGYALATAASAIYLSETALVGSIGVIHTLFSCVELDRKMGLEFAVIASGERKRYGHPSLPISEAAVTSAQRDVNFLAGLFFELVAESRPLDVAAISALEAGLLIGKDAVAAKLADDVCSFDQLLETLSSSNAASAAVTEDKDNNMSWKESLKKAADEGDEEAKKALKALEEGDDEKKDDDKSESEDDKSSKAEDGEGDKKDDDEKKESSASTADPNLSLAATVQSLAAWKAEREEREERERLMASRPDLAAEVVSFLDRQPLAVVRDAVKTLPRGVAKAAGQVGAARAAIGVVPKAATPPDGPSGTLPPKEHAEVLAGMGIRTEQEPEASVKVLEGGLTQFRFRPAANTTTAASAAEKGTV